MEVCGVVEGALGAARSPASSYSVRRPAQAAPCTATCRLQGRRRGGSSPAAALTLCLCGDLGELRGRGITDLGVVAGHVGEQAPHVGLRALVVAHAPHNVEPQGSATSRSRTSRQSKHNRSSLTRVRSAGWPFNQGPLTSARSRRRGCGSCLLAVMIQRRSCFFAAGPHRADECHDDPPPPPCRRLAAALRPPPLPPPLPPLQPHDA